MRLENKIAMVTGAASGIGEGIAHALTAEGARVGVCDIDKAKGDAVAADLPGSVFIDLDVTSTPSVVSGVDRIIAELGPIDILVNCAGTDVVKPFLETDEELWHWLIDLNLMGVLRCTKAVLPTMVERGSGGRLINIASDAGRVGSSGEAAYSGAKGGVIAFTKTIAREVARHQITANTVCSGPDRDAAAAEDGRGGRRRLHRCDEEDHPRCADWVSPPTSPPPSPSSPPTPRAFITGQTLSVSGGMSMLPASRR